MTTVNTQSRLMHQVYYKGEYMGLVSAIPADAIKESIRLIRIYQDPAKNAEHKIIHPSWMGPSGTIYTDKQIGPKDIGVDASNHSKFQHMM